MTNSKGRSKSLGTQVAFWNSSEGKEFRSNGKEHRMGTTASAGRATCVICGNRTISICTVCKVSVCTKQKRLTEMDKVLEATPPSLRGRCDKIFHSEEVLRTNRRRKKKRKFEEMQETGIHWHSSDSESNVATRMVTRARHIAEAQQNRINTRSTTAGQGASRQLWSSRRASAPS